MIIKEYLFVVYGGVGVYVVEFVVVFRQDIEVCVCVFGDLWDEYDIFVYWIFVEFVGVNVVLQMLGMDFEIVLVIVDVDVVYLYIWYVNFVGYFVVQLYGILYVFIVYSLELLCFWKVEQFGGGYVIFSGIECFVYENVVVVIVVSVGMCVDIFCSYFQVDLVKVCVIYNGIDVQRWYLVEDEVFLWLIGFDLSCLFVVFVGCIIWQKGLFYFLWVVWLLFQEVQFVFCVGVFDMLEIMIEVQEGVCGLQEIWDGVIWIEWMLLWEELLVIFIVVMIFVCLLIYELFGIVNFEVMVCGVVVVGIVMGGILEVVVDGVMGRLVLIEQLQDGIGIFVDLDCYVVDFVVVLIEVVMDLEWVCVYGEVGCECV